MSCVAEPLRTLIVRGPFRGPSGHDHHIREFVRELHRQGIGIQLFDLPQWTAAKLPPALRDDWFDSLKEQVEANIVLHFTTPHYALPCRGKRNANFTMFEASRIPPQWVRQSRQHELVILPTESSREAWIRSGAPEERIRLCPLGVDPARYAQGVEPLELSLSDGTPVFSYRTRFLNISELGPRKNLPGLLRAWIRATDPRDDAVLIFKTGAWVPGAAEMFDAQVATLQKQVGKQLNEAAPVLFLRRMLGDAEMPRLYTAATHYISMSFGEGWDLAMMEAAAAGLRLIAPAHSAYTAYLDSSTARLLPSREVRAAFRGDSATAALFRDANWWEPDEQEAIASIREAIEDRDRPAASARQRILNDFTCEKAVARLIQILGEINRPVRR